MSGEESADTVQRQTLARGWASFLHASGLAGISAHAMVESLYPQLERGQPRDAGWDELRGAIEYFVPPRPGQNPDPAKLGDVIGRRFRGAALRVADAPAPLVCFAFEGKSGGRARWRVLPVDEGAAGQPPEREPPTSPPADVDVDADSEERPSGEYDPAEDFDRGGVDYGDARAAEAPA